MSSILPLACTIGCISLVACLSNPDTVKSPCDLSAPPEDSSMAGLRVRSFFNKESGREWRRVFGEGGLEDERVRFVSPPHSARFISTDTMSSIIEKVLSPPEDVCGDVNVSLKVSAPSQANLKSVHHLSISLVGGENHGDSANFGLHHLVREIELLNPSIWTRINLPLRAFNTSPTFDCRKVVRVRLRLGATAGSVDTLNLGQLSFYPAMLPQAALLFTEDDQWADFDTNGTPAMARHGFPGTIYANGGLVGTPGKMGLARLKALQDSGGWTVGNHLWMHDSMTALNDDSARSSLRMNAEFLKGNGITGHAHFAYPYGRVDRAKDSLVRLECESARLTLGWPQGEATPYSDPYRLRVIGFLDSKVTLDAAKAAVNRLVENRTAGMVGIHQIVTDGPLDGNKWYRSDWEALLDHVRTLSDQGRLKVYSLEGFLRAIAPPR